MYISAAGYPDIQYANEEAYYTTDERLTITQLTEEHTYELNGNKAYVDGALAHEWEETTFETAQRPLFGALRGSSSSSLYTANNIELYELQYWQDNTGSMTSHLLPYERISDGVIGFYDHISGHFLEPLQGAFISGGYLNIPINANDISDNKRKLLDYIDKKVTEDVTPEYIKTEAERVCSVVRQHQAPNSLTWLSVSDMHCLNGDKNDSLYDMARAVEQIRLRIALDLCVSHGDITYRMNNYTDYDAGVAEAREAWRNWRRHYRISRSPGYSGAQTVNKRHVFRKSEGHAVCNMKTERR